MNKGPKFLGVHDLSATEHIVGNVMGMTHGDGNKAMELILSAALYIAQNSGMDEPSESCPILDALSTDGRFNIHLSFIKPEDETIKH